MLITQMNIQLPNDFQDIYKSHFGLTSSSHVYTHCKCELMQAIWELLLDERFVNAYKNGCVIIFRNGITCCAFFWFFTYSANYPEK